MSDESHAHEIIIVKHHGGHEDAHHGGVWKIAFADFMTAMMAFFLVMWLLSANDKTKVAIAKYFNPVELVDSTPQPPGLNDPKKTDPSVSPSHRPVSQGKEGTAPTSVDGGGTSADDPSGQSDAVSAHDEAELTRDPYAVLAEIANKANHASPDKKVAQKTEEAQRGVGSQARKNGEAFRDPFEMVQIGSQDPPPGAIISGPAGATAELTAPPPVAPPPPASASAAAASATSASSATPAATAANAVSEVTAAPASATGKDIGTAAAADAAQPSPVPDDKPVAPGALRAKIAALAKADGTAGTSPKLDVRQTSEGLLISLTDSADFSMFPISSARPAGKTVLLIQKIGALLKSQKGTVVVRGFTDSRPFKSDTYDNWRLSATRAQMAHYLLVSGGVSDARFDGIEGYADRRPKNAKNPEAAENRRIEILLRDPTP